MIARIFILLVLITLLPDIYIYRRYLRHRFDLKPWQRLLWWMPGSVITAFTLAYATIDAFAPDDLTVFNAFLFLLGLIVVPKMLFVLASLCGRLVCRMFGLRRNWGNYVGLVLVLGEWYVLFTGTMVGNDRLAVHHVTIEFDDLPQAFDGYRIVQFSDIHLGSMRSELLERAVEHVNALRPDMIVFTGDIQNTKPQELPPFATTLRKLRARDGIYSVLGNHDYTQYVPQLSDAQKAVNERLTRTFETSLGWHLLMNGHDVVRRGTDSMFVAGEENDGLPPFPQKADIRRTLAGVPAGAFVVMLQHDPSAWRKSILPDSHAQLTLSGHTHGGQMSLFGLRPTELKLSEDAGLYREGNRALYVSTGLGGFLPFRFHMDPEVVEITLRKTGIE